LSLAGVDHFGFGADPDTPSWEPEALLGMDFRDDVGAVLVGFDTNYSYNKIYKAVSYLSNPDCLYLVTNHVETVVQLAENRYQPVTGALLAPISIASRRQPTVIGKPFSLMFDCILKKYPDIVKSRTVFVGDSMKADIPFARSVGIDSLLVLSGASSLTTVHQHPEGLQPTYYAQSLAVIGQ
jgi:HAD superfamily hydrolase (TIGR01450 family)